MLGIGLTKLLLPMWSKTTAARSSLSPPSPSSGPDRGPGLGLSPSPDRYPGPGLDPMSWSITSP